MKSGIVWLAVGAIVIAVSACELHFPLYPSPHSFCSLLEERMKIPSQVEEHNRGAVLIVSGEAVGGPGGPEFFEAPCGWGSALVGLEVPSTAIATPRSREILASLRNPAFARERRSVGVRLLARVASNVNACFAPGTVLTALAVQVTGPVRVQRLSPRNPG